jgi:lysophospholipase L1-like esterase
MRANGWAEIGVAVALAGALTVRGEGDVQQRIVFLGDSITDGFSYPSLVRQALREAGRPVPVCFNAGIGGDTAAGKKKRLERDVLAHRPTLMALSTGINDVLRKVPVESYEADVRSVLEQLKAANVPVLVMTTSVLGPKTGDADQRLEGFNAALGKLAAELGCRVADVNARMRRARTDGVDVLEADHVHPNYAGHRVMARTVLDALGYADVPLPAELKPQPYPGLVTPWKVIAVADPKQKLDDAGVAALAPDDTWKTVTLPQAEKSDNWWNEQGRQEGIASLEAVAGKAPLYRGVAVVQAAAGERFLNAGAALQAVWLNGACVYRASEEWRGYHLGRDRVPVQLKAGDNTLVIESGSQFILTLTARRDWETEWGVK